MNDPLCFSRVSLRSGILDDVQRPGRPMPLKKKFQRKHIRMRTQMQILLRLEGFLKNPSTPNDWMAIAVLRWTLGENIEL